MATRMDSDALANAESAAAQLVSSTPDDTTCGGELTNGAAALRGIPMKSCVED